MGAIGEEYASGTLRRLPLLARAARAHHEGRIADAEALAEEAFGVLTETGHRSAFAFYAGQLIAIRRDQGRIGEILPLIAMAADDNPAVVAFQTALCMAYAEEEQLAEAEAVLRRLAVDGFSTIPYDAFWLPAMCFCAGVERATRRSRHCRRAARPVAAVRGDVRRVADVGGSRRPLRRRARRDVRPVRRGRRRLRTSGGDGGEGGRGDLPRPDPGRLGSDAARPFRAR